MAPVDPVVLRCTFDYLVDRDDALTRTCAMTVTAQDETTLIEDFEAPFPASHLVAALLPDGTRRVEDIGDELTRFIEQTVFPGLDELSIGLSRLIANLATTLGDHRPTLRVLTDLFFFGPCAGPRLGFARGQIDDSDDERYLLWDFRVRDGRSRVTVDDRTQTGAELKLLLSDPAALEALAGPVLQRLFVPHEVGA